MSEKSHHMTMEEFAAQHPHLIGFFKYIDRLNKESEMGAVLISATMIDELLRQTILAHLMDVPEAGGLLDGSNAPLGTFSARTTAAYCQGLIDKTEFDEITRIRKIRNDFAHSMETSFQTRSVIDRCATLTLAAKSYVKDDGTRIEVDARGQFTTAAISVVGRLNNRPHHAAKARLVWLNPAN